jgi:hypothetical protein
MGPAPADGPTRTPEPSGAPARRAGPPATDLLLRLLVHRGVGGACVARCGALGSWWPRPRCLGAAPANPTPLTPPPTKIKCANFSSAIACSSESLRREYRSLHVHCPDGVAKRDSSGPVSRLIHRGFEIKLGDPPWYQTERNSEEPKGERDSLLTCPAPASRPGRCSRGERDKSSVRPSSCRTAPSSGHTPATSGSPMGLNSPPTR